MKKFLLDRLDPNGSAGHLWLGILGLIIGLGEFFLGFQPDPESLLVLAGVVIFATLLIPAAGMDRENELNVLVIMTFGTSGVFGATAGAMVASVLGDLSPSLLTPSMGWSFLLVVLVCKSYWECGYLSRELLARVFSSVQVDASVTHFVAFLERHRFHVRVRDLRRSILDLNPQEAEKILNGIEAVLRTEGLWTESIGGLFGRARDGIRAFISSGGEVNSSSSDKQPARKRVKIYPAQQ